MFELKPKPCRKTNNIDLNSSGGKSFFDENSYNPVNFTFYPARCEKGKNFLSSIFDIVDEQNGNLVFEELSSLYEGLAMFYCHPLN